MTRSPGPSTLSLSALLYDEPNNYPQARIVCFAFLPAFWMMVALQNQVDMSKSIFLLLRTPLPLSGSSQ